MKQGISLILHPDLPLLITALESVKPVTELPMAGGGVYKRYNIDGINVMLFYTHNGRIADVVASTHLIISLPESN